MKRLLALIFALCLLLTACGEAADPTAQTVATDPTAQTEKPASKTLETILNPTEYILYQNIFYNQTGDDYVGKEQTKHGIFTTIHDSWNSVTRYYVWGYNDQTKCCDWQWEFVPADPASLPSVGSTVEVTGVFAKDEAALDGYWLSDASVQTKTDYEGAGVDFDLTTMGDTLERVQIYNILQFADEYEGKTIRAYGRIASPTSIEDPYYSGSWTQDFASADTIPAIGTMVILDGVCKNAVISDCTITATNDY